MRYTPLPLNSYGRHSLTGKGDEWDIHRESGCFDIDANAIPPVTKKNRRHVEARPFCYSVKEKDRN
jgi:hypothetical protein